MRVAIAIVVGALTGGFVGYMAGAWLACYVLSAGNLCGLLGVFVTGPAGIIAGTLAVLRLAGGQGTPPGDGPPQSRGRLVPVVLLIVLAAVAIATVLSTSAPSPPSPAAASLPATASLPVKVLSVTLRADPADHHGPCPVEFSFRGRIQVEGGPGVVRYRFVRSDHATGPVETITIARAGVQEVSTAWALGNQGPRPFEAWEAIEIVEPGERRSNPASFRMTCEP